MRLLFAGLPTRTIVETVVERPFMSLTVSRTRQLPELLHVLVAVAALPPKLRSPKSQKYASSSPSASLAVAVKVTAVPVGTSAALAVNEATGRLPASGSPRFTCTSMYGRAAPDALVTVPLATGVTLTSDTGSVYVRPSTTYESLRLSALEGLVSMSWL